MSSYLVPSIGSLGQLPAVLVCSVFAPKCEKCEGGKCLFKLTSGLPVKWCDRALSVCDQSFANALDEPQF